MTSDSFQLISAVCHAIRRTGHITATTIAGEPMFAVAIAPGCKLIVTAATMQNVRAVALRTLPRPNRTAKL